MRARHIEREQDIKPLVVELACDACQYVQADHEYSAQSRSGGVKTGLEPDGFGDGKFADEKAGAEQCGEHKQSHHRYAGADGFDDGVLADGGDMHERDRFFNGRNSIANHDAE